MYSSQISEKTHYHVLEKKIYILKNIIKFYQRKVKWWSNRIFVLI